MNVFQAYSTLWPAEHRARLMPFLGQVETLSTPVPRPIPAVIDPRRTVVVSRAAYMEEMNELLERKFQHIVQSTREDFPQELLASCLMIQQPQKFLDNPMVYFLSGFDPGADPKSQTHNLSTEFRSSDDKGIAMAWIEDFLEKHPDTRYLRDVVMQIADELVMNALFNAPVDVGGGRPYQSRPRTAHVTYPDTVRSARLFACFNQNKLIVGCEDPFGSIQRKEVMAKVSKTFTDGKISGQGGSSGAGLGIRLMLENSANFYLMRDPGRRTLFACGLLLEGLKANFSAKKHVHLLV